MSSIVDVVAREILDSRGQPTVEAKPPANVTKVICRRAEVPNSRASVVKAGSYSVEAIAARTAGHV